MNRVILAAGATLLVLLVAGGVLLIQRGPEAAEAGAGPRAVSARGGPDPAEGLSRQSGGAWRALLVGCDEYPELRKRFPQRYERELRLRGPSRDVALMRRVLMEVFGVPGENVITLVGADPQARPTSTNIRRALSQLAREVGEGDRVVLYFAGHGSQQRDQAGDELDGLDEVFLPADVGPKTGPKGAIPHALSDDQLGRAARNLRDAGATVWMIFDCCHAGTMARGGSERVRGIDPSLFGVTSTARGSLGGSLAERRGDGGELTGIVAFYASESYARAPEMELPEEGGDTHGLFTWLLARELTRTGPGLTYHQLLERLVQAYQAYPGAGTIPQAEGDLDRTIATGESRESASPGLVELFAGAGDDRLRVALPEGPQGSSLRDELGRHPDRFLPVEGGADADCRVAVADGLFTLAIDGRLPNYLDLERPVLLNRLAALHVTRALARAVSRGWAQRLGDGLEVRIERRAGGKGSAKPLGPGAVMHPGDTIRMLMEKRDDALVDVFVFYVDANLEVVPLFPCDGESPRLSHVEGRVVELTEDGFTVTDDALGLERLLVLAVPREVGQPEVDFGGLTGLASSRGGDAGELLALLSGGEAARGGEALDVAPRVGIVTVRTAWPALGPPAWPERGVVTLDPPLASESGGEPDAWALTGDRAALASSPGSRTYDLLLVGDAEAPRHVFVDLDGGKTRPLDGDALAALLRERAFEAEVVFHFSDDRWTALYDCDGDGDHDLALVDESRDGIADLRRTRTHENWSAPTPVQVPWLSQGHLRLPALLGGADPTVSRRFQALLR